MTSRAAIVQIDNLSAAYGRGSNRVQALGGINLNINAGQIFGLLGPNGAGKTTLLSCIQGLHQPETGRVRVAGQDVASDPAAVQAKLGIQFQHSALLDDLKVAELVRVYAALYEVYLTSRQISSLLARFGLEDISKKLARRLSGGQKQRLVLALSLAADPEIVLLDEPTSALDPHARRAIWAVIRKLLAEGRTIIITTHSMEEAEFLCERVAIIDAGRVIACDTPARLVANLGARPVLKINLDAPVEQIRCLPGVHTTRQSGSYLEIETSEPMLTLPALHQLAIRLGSSVGDVALHQPNLEDVFLQLTGRPLTI